uniref:Uncharacterized protein n=1 Tax=uncultured marine group II/III euryarchaeote KM3_85_D06 TaxID=1456528 RepID=A0A075HZ79_9EURY|nr:hypothetical protein [uncultured marine group II/III euryarchaeote KM3_85_D06]
MCHLICLVLAKANLGGVGPYRGEEVVCEGHEEANGMVTDELFCYRVPNRHRGWLWVWPCGVWHEVERLAIPRREVVNGWRFGVHEVLQLSHVELSLANHSLSGTNLVTVPLPDLNDAEWQSLSEVPLDIREG